MEVRQNLIELCDKITHGHYVMTQESAEYQALEQWITDDEIKIVMGLDLLKPTLGESLAYDLGMDEAFVMAELRKLADIGLLMRIDKMGMELYLMNTWAPGIFEFILVNDEFCQKHPEVPRAFQKHGTKTQEGFIENVPMGSGVMRVIPFEKAIENTSEVADFDRLSYYVERQKNHIAILPCQCRRVRRYMDEGAGDLEGAADLETGMCIFLGAAADMFIENGKGMKITKEECYEKLRYCEKIGCVHQITTLDPGTSVAICNCMPKTCLALGASEYFNTPDQSRSNYVAEVDAENCVACGACVEFCADNALRLGQKLCTKTPIVVPDYDKPNDTEWGPEKWNVDYRNNRELVMPTGTAPCKTTCPAHIAVQGYIKKAAEGKFNEALEVIKRENPFPAVCGRICPHNCESECTRGAFDEAVSIDEIKKYIADKEMESAFQFIPKKLHNYGKKIAVVGSGPAGLSCAYYLARDGYKVTVFEKERAVGGMMIKGIPSFRLEKGVVNAEIDVLKQMGVEFKVNTEVGKDVSLDFLRGEGYEAFYIAIGAQGGRKLGIEGEGAKGVFSGVDFLRNIAFSIPKPKKLKGKVVVIGGGNVAIDVARTAVRSGAEETAMYCLEAEAEMPALPEELAEAKGEGIAINNGWGPKRILVGDDGKVCGVEFKKCVSVFDAEGKFAPAYDENDVKTVDANFVLLSVGQSIEWGELLKGSKVELGRGNTAVADSFTYQTAEPDVFVGGDVYTGPKFAIDAIAAGKEGADSIHRFVQPGQSLTIGRDKKHYISLDKDNLDKDEIKKGWDNTARQKPFHDPAKAKTFKDDRMALTDLQLQREANRCLGCGATIVDQYKCFGCGVCTEMCKFDAIHLVKKYDVQSIQFFERDEAFPKYKAERAEKIKIKAASK